MLNNHAKIVVFLINYPTNQSNYLLVGASWHYVVNKIVLVTVYKQFYFFLVNIESTTIDIFCKASVAMRS